MVADARLAANGETIELQQQVASLQALLEASRQVHSTIREEEVMESVLRIVVREGFSRDMADMLLKDLRAVIGELESAPPARPKQADQHFHHG